MGPLQLSEHGGVVPGARHRCPSCWLGVPPRHHDRVVGWQRPHAQNALGQVLGSPGAGPGGRCHDRPSHEVQKSVAVGGSAIAGTIGSFGSPLQVVNYQKLKQIYDEPFFVGFAELWWNLCDMLPLRALNFGNYDKPSANTTQSFACVAELPSRANWNDDTVFRND